MGPIFGEQIDLYSVVDAKALVARRRALPLPCSWTDAGIRWQAKPEPRFRLGDDDFMYLLRRLTGDFPYNYEVSVRRGGYVLTFVLNSHRPNLLLAKTLVGRAVARFDNERAA